MFTGKHQVNNISQNEQIANGTLFYFCTSMQTSVMEDVTKD